MPSLETALRSIVLASVLWIAAASPSYAYGDERWCAVSNRGMGWVVWDCQYRTWQECVPNVIAGNRGFCNLNPGWEPRAAPARHKRRHHRHA
ncbi:MAG TPA: DUF3551 domain-containing protein [Pseudolabrys sp.]|nr:DUF3551 domain-containing protein [Pseudolabrys sp.]